MWAEGALAPIAGAQEARKRKWRFGKALRVTTTHSHGNFQRQKTFEWSLSFIMQVQTSTSQSICLTRSTGGTYVFLPRTIYHIEANITTPPHIAIAQFLQLRCQQVQPHAA